MLAPRKSSPERILDALREGAKTTEEISAHCAMNMWIVKDCLAELFRTGKVERGEARMLRRGDRGNSPYLYWLPPRKVSEAELVEAEKRLFR